MHRISDNDGLLVRTVIKRYHELNYEIFRHYPEIDIYNFEHLVLVFLNCKQSCQGESIAR